MKRLWVVALSIALGGLFGYYYSSRSNAAEAGELDNFTSWTPDSAALHRQLAAAPGAGPAGQPDEAHKTLLGELLTTRFRSHDPKIAVRVKFEHDAAQHKDLIKLMCPARMEPWNMDWLATNTWREVKANLGTSYDLDIYITYIGLSQIKVAELRPLPGNPDKVEIRYRTPDEVRHAMNGDVAASPASAATR